MNQDAPVKRQSRRRFLRTLKWLSFGLELFLLWVLCNSLFLVPGPYAGPRGLMIGGAALLSTGAAWISGRMFHGSGNGSVPFRGVLSTPPAVICMFVVCVAATVMAMAVLANR